MPFTTNKGQFLMKNNQILSEIFHVASEGDLLKNYLSEEELHACINAGDSNMDSIAYLTSIVYLKKNNDLFVALLQRIIYLFRQSQQFILNMKETLDEEDKLCLDEIETETLTSEGTISFTNDQNSGFKSSSSFEEESFGNNEKKYKKEIRRLERHIETVEAEFKSSQDREEDLNKVCCELQVKLIYVQNLLAETLQECNETSQSGGSKENMEELQNQLNECKKNETFLQEKLASVEQENEKLTEELLITKQLLNESLNLQDGENQRPSSVGGASSEGDKKEKIKENPPRKAKEKRKTIFSILKRSSNSSLFPLPPTDKMQKVLDSYMDEWKRPALFHDGTGAYKQWNWKNDDSRNWENQWRGIIGKTSEHYLYFPALLLPVELGGYLVAIWLGWNDGLNLFGIILPNEHNVICPKEIKMKIAVNIYLHETETISKEFTTAIKNFRTDTGTTYILGEISATVDCLWPCPSAEIKLSKH